MEVEVTIDKFGKILIPKKLRTALGIYAGQKVVLKVTTDKELKIQPNPPKARLIEERGLLVVAADQGDFTNVDWEKVIQQDREERIDKLSNWKK